MWSSRREQELERLKRIVDQLEGQIRIKNAHIKVLKDRIKEIKNNDPTRTN